MCTAARLERVPEMLSSYVAGTWYTAPDDGAVLVDAATGEDVARLSSTGLDTQAMIEHARRAGGPALKRMTFQARAAALKALAAHLDANKAAYYALSTATGATHELGDAWFLSSASDAASSSRSEATNGASGRP